MVNLLVQCFVFSVSGRKCFSNRTLTGGEDAARTAGLETGATLLA
jgi:hypothetical protein